MMENSTVEKLAKSIIKQEEIFILDIRNEEAFADWKIEGKSVEIINEPYFNLLDGLDSVKDKLPLDKNIFVVCAKGGSSEMVMKLLDEEGYSNAYNLLGGMKAWSEHLEPVKIADLKNGGSLYQFVRLGKGCLSYLIESDGEAVVIDTARMINVYEDFAKQKDLKITKLLDSHLHADHISGGRALAEKVGGTYHLPPKDATEITFDYEALEEGNDITIGKTVVKIQPLYSPGHTIGSTSFIIDNKFLLTGDILFIKSIGRPDLAGLAADWAGDLSETLYSKYKKLSEELIVLPAHFSFIEELNDDGSVQAQLGDLYNRNSGLQVESETEFRKLVSENLPPQPNSYEEIRKTNMGKANPTLETKSEMEVGPNRCAVE